MQRRSPRHGVYYIRPPQNGIASYAYAYTLLPLMEAQCFQYQRRIMFNFYSKLLQNKQLHIAVHIGK